MDVQRVKVRKIRLLVLAQTTETSFMWHIKDVSARFEFFIKPLQKLAVSPSVRPANISLQL